MNSGIKLSATLLCIFVFAMFLQYRSALSVTEKDGEIYYDLATTIFGGLRAGKYIRDGIDSMCIVQLPVTIDQTP